MPFVGTATGYVDWKKPSRIRQALKQGRVQHHAKSGENDFYFWIYPESPERTDMARAAIAYFLAREQEAERILWEREEHDKKASQRTAENALQQRIRLHRKELIAGRELPPNTPIEALALPRKIPRIHYVGNDHVK